jgi:arylesterase / paraoxonase
MKLPNGITRARDGLIYAVNTIPSVIQVFSLTEERQLQQEDEIHVELPMDNLSIDQNGDIYAAAFPQVHKWGTSSKDPSVGVPTAVFRIRRAGKGYRGTSRKGMEIYQGEYEVEKIIEDDGSLLPGSTSAVHDPMTGRIFLAGVMSPFVAVCETR